MTARLPTTARRHAYAVYQRLPAPVRRRVRRWVLRLTARNSRSTAELLVARTRFGAGHYEDAATLLAQARQRDPDNVAILDLTTKVAGKRGEISEAADASVAKLGRERSTKSWSATRRLLGRLVETDARWRPTVCSPAPEGAPLPGRALYLAKESRPYLHNGFCTRTHESLRWLQRLGTDVRGVTMPGFPGVIGVTDAPRSSTVEEVVYDHLLPAAGKELAALAFDEQLQLAAQALAGEVTRTRPALLHVGSGHRGFETALVGDAVARWAGIPWIYEVRSFFETTWTADARYMEKGEQYHRRFETETRMMQAADLVITLSGPMRDEIVQRHGVSPELVRVVPNAVDPGRFAPQPRDEELRRRLRLDGSRTIGYVSNLSHPREGQEVLVRAVAAMREGGREVTGLVVGDGSRREQLEDLARHLGVGAYVRFTGNVPFDEVAAYYAQMDLFVVPRIDERAARMVSPMKPFEAMAMRVPLLVSDLPALVEIAGDGERAGTFRAGDAGSLATEAGRLLDSPATLAGLVDAAASWVAAERSWEAVAVAFRQAYDDVLARFPMASTEQAGVGSC